MKKLSKVQKLRSIERGLRNVLVDFSENYKELITLDDKIKCLENTLYEMGEYFDKAAELQDFSIWFRLRTMFSRARIDLYKKNYVDLSFELESLKEFGGD